jgi:hypothetical protein
MRSFLLSLTLTSIILFSGACKNKHAADAGSKDSVILYSEFHDFESVTDPRLDSTKAYSGRKSGLLNDKIEYSYGLSRHIGEISSFKNMNAIHISFKCWMDKKFPDATFVLSIDDEANSKNILWEGKPIELSRFNDWVPVSIDYKVNNDFIKPGYTLKLYIWNKGKNIFNFDDISYTFLQRKP